MADETWCVLFQPPGHVIDSDVCPIQLNILKYFDLEIWPEEEPEWGKAFWRFREINELPLKTFYFLKPSPRTFNRARDAQGASEKNVSQTGLIQKVVKCFVHTRQPGSAWNEKRREGLMQLFR